MEKQLTLEQDREMMKMRCRELQEQFGVWVCYCDPAIKQTAFKQQNDIETTKKEKHKKRGGKF